MKVITFLNFLLYLLLFISCQNESKIHTDYIYLTDNMKLYQYLKDSYWVYQNDSIRIIDSISVINSYKAFCVQQPSFHGSNETKAEYFSIIYKSFLYQKEYNDRIFNGSIVRSYPEENYCFPGQEIYCPGMEKGDTISGLSLTDTIPVLILNGFTFKNVDKYKITQKEQRWQAFDHDMFIYFSDSVGIIKKEILDKYGNIESWSLLRWKVIR